MSHMQFVHGTLLPFLMTFNGEPGAKESGLLGGLGVEPSWEGKATPTVEAAAVPTVGAAGAKLPVGTRWTMG